MFKCLITVLLPLYEEDSDEPVFFSIAEYDFDPDLYPGDEVYVSEAEFGQTLVTDESSKVDKRVAGEGPTFSFNAQVVERSKIIEPGASTNSNGELVDQFTLIVLLEIADKEQVPAMVAEVKELFPEMRELPLRDWDNSESDGDDEDESEDDDLEEEVESDETS